MFRNLKLWGWVQNPMILSGNGWFSGLVNIIKITDSALVYKKQAPFAYIDTKSRSHKTKVGFNLDSVCSVWTLISISIKC